MNHRWVNLHNYTEDDLAGLPHKIIQSIIYWTLLASNAALASCPDWYTKKKIKLTAYYSPLRWQEYYSRIFRKWKFTWKRRTFQQEQRMQGKWTHTASWKAVKIWMLAWPKSYKFWTPLKINWLQKYWLPVEYSIQDRWWKIKGNKFDIYVWKWQEWLQKAEKMGLIKMSACIWDILDVKTKKSPPKSYKKTSLPKNYKKTSLESDEKLLQKWAKALKL